MESATIPLVQDTADAGVWSSWKVEYRDVVVVDGAGKKRSVLNLTSHDLSVETNRATLKDMLHNAK